MPLEQRKQLLASVVQEGPRLRLSAHFELDGATVYEHVRRFGFEGIVSKRRGAAYQPGIRATSWQKVTCAERQEFVVGGFNDADVPARGVGSLLIGYYDEAGALIWAGKVSRGLGLTDAVKHELRALFATMTVKDCPFSPRPPGWLGKNAHWIAPQLVIDVRFRGWTNAGMVRHATMVGVRQDKLARDVVRERPVDVTGGSAQATRAVEAAVPLRPSVPTAKTAAPTRARSARAVPRVVTDTRTPQHLVFPEVGVSRADLARLYGEISEWVLPHVSHRPLTLVHCAGEVTEENALRSQCAFLHHTSDDQGFLHGVPRVQIQEQKKIGEYTFVDSIDALSSLVLGGVVELHQWNAKVDDHERPDRVVMDLDPGEGVAWDQVLEAARLVRSHLDELELESWPRSSGGCGLHIVVPFDPVSWEAAYAFSRNLAERIARGRPWLTTSFIKRDRTGRILLDYKRNYRTAVAVGTYSTRARPRGPMAVPLAWSEVGARLHPDQWDVTNIRRRLDCLRADPWSGYLRCRQQLPAAVTKNR